MFIAALFLVVKLGSTQDVHPQVNVVHIQPTEYY